MLEHPACVWDVAFLPNGDLVTGCADFAARVWTSSAERTASAETIQVSVLKLQRANFAVQVHSNSSLDGSSLVCGMRSSCGLHVRMQSFMAALEARKAAAKAGGGGGAGALPEGLTLEDPMVLTQPGSRDGQTKIIREGGGGMAYSWSAARSVLCLARVVVLPGTCWQNRQGCCKGDPEQLFAGDNERHCKHPA